VKLSLLMKHGAFKENDKSLQWKWQTFPQPNKAHMLKSQMTIVLITFFDIKGIVNFRLISQGHTVIQAYYVEILKGLCENVHRKRPELWPSD